MARPPFTEEWLQERLAQGLLRLVGEKNPHASRAQESERDFLSRVLTVAKIEGWHAYHTHDSRKSAPGFPDLVLLQPKSRSHVSGRLLFVELKTRTGKLTKEQQQWLSMLGTVVGIECYLWRPHDWATIVAILTERTDPCQETCVQVPGH